MVGFVHPGEWQDLKVAVLKANVFERADTLRTMMSSPAALGQLYWTKSCHAEGNASIWSLLFGAKQQ